MSKIVVRAPRRARVLGLLGVVLATALSGALAVLAPVPSATADTTSQYGTVSGSSATLPGANLCGTYAYAYDVTPPPGNWILETAVTDPRDNKVSSCSVLGDYSPGGGHATTPFDLCRNNTAAGIFTITAHLTVVDDAGRTRTTYQLAPATFTVTDAPVAAKTTKHKHEKKHHKKNR